MKNRIPSIAYAVTLPALLFLSQVNAATPTPEPPVHGVIVLAVPEQAKVHFQNGESNSTESSRHLSDAFATLGYRLELAFFPGTRALAQANTGIVDGVFTHPKGNAFKYINLLPVETPTTEVEIGLYSRNDGGDKRWTQRVLKRVAFVQGMNLPDNFEVRDSKVQTSKSAQQSLKLLQSERVDAILIADMTLQVILDSTPELAQNLMELTPKITPFKLHTYLHKRHEALLPALSEQLRLERLKPPLEN